MEQKISKRTWNWIWQVAGPGRKWVAAKTVFRALQGFAGLGYAYALRAVVDSAVAGNSAGFFASIWVLAALALGSVALLALSRYADEKSKAVLEREYRMRFFSQILHRDYTAVTKIHSGEWMNRMTSDTGVVVSGVSAILPEFAGVLVRLLGALICLYATAPQMVYILLPWGAVMALFSYSLRARLKRLHRNVQEADGAARSFIQERLYSLLAIHAFTREEITEERGKQHLEALVHARVRKNRLANLSSTALSAALLGAQIIGVLVCCHGILNDTVTFGTMSAVLYLIGMLEGPMAGISSFVPAVYTTSASAQRLMEIEQYPVYASEDPVPMNEIRHFYRQKLAALGLENACFAYEDDPDNAVLQNLNLHIKKGEFVAFTGQSGCGKTTTLKVLLNLYPLDSGCAYLQQIDGSKLTLTSGWRSLFAYVPQGNQLTYGTVRETIAFSDPALMKQDAALWEALRIACADGFVEELPDGLDSVLGERGTGLSEGQQQRLAVARALLTGRPVLLLDEATSALDAATEKKLMENLRSMTDRTVLVITHRENVIRYCDKHIHFEK